MLQSTEAASLENVEKANDAAIEEKLKEMTCLLGTCSEYKNTSQPNN